MPEVPQSYLSVTRQPSEALSFTFPDQFPTADVLNTKIARAIETIFPEYLPSATYTPKARSHRGDHAFQVLSRYDGPNRVYFGAQIEFQPPEIEGERNVSYLVVSLLGPDEEYRKYPYPIEVNEIKIRGEVFAGLGVWNRRELDSILRGNVDLHRRSSWAADPEYESAVFVVDNPTPERLLRAGQYVDVNLGEGPLNAVMKMSGYSEFSSGMHKLVALAKSTQGLEKRIASFNEEAASLGKTVGESLSIVDDSLVVSQWAEFKQMQEDLQPQALALYNVLPDEFKTALVDPDYQPSEPKVASAVMD